MTGSGEHASCEQAIERLPTDTARTWPPNRAKEIPMNITATNLEIVPAPDEVPLSSDEPAGAADGRIRRVTVRVTRRQRLRRAQMGAVTAADDIVHYGVAIVLMAVAGVVLCHTIYDLAKTSAPFAQAATTAVNGVLFAIIVMEVMRTVMAHFDRGGLQLQPFLVIGIISAVREILSVGAHLSLQGAGQGGGSISTVHLALLELGVNGALVLGLAAALVLIRRLAGMVATSPTEQE
jgi:uncharacterized membrane protein (DUF373 family)